MERRRNGLMEGGTSGAWTDFQGEQWESASKIMFIAGIEQHQHYGILCCQPWPGGDLLSRGGDQVLIWLYIYNTALHFIRSLVAKSAETKFVCSTDVPESQIKRFLFTSAFF